MNMKNQTTAEVPLTSIYASEVIDAEQLPLLMMAYTPCYRREAGSAGRDTRGMLRAHEFDKVEILAVAAPEQAPGLLVEMTARAEATSGIASPVRRARKSPTRSTGRPSPSHESGRRSSRTTAIPTAASWCPKCSVRTCAVSNGSRGDERSDVEARRLRIGRSRRR